jgi:hypothetical protein
VLLLPGWSVQPSHTPKGSGWVTSERDFFATAQELPVVLDADELIQVRNAMADIVREGQLASKLARSDAHGR